MGTSDFHFWKLGRGKVAERGVGKSQVDNFRVVKPWID